MTRFLVTGFVLACFLFVLAWLTILPMLGLFYICGWLA